jgi:hypothetical protein
MSETLLGEEIKEDFSMKKCCNVCGFPLDIPRKPVILDSNILSMFDYEHNTCLSCGHQKDGSTIPVVYYKIQELCNKFFKERDDLIKFLHYYTFLDKEGRKEVCVMLPRFMQPNYKSDGSSDGDILEPYSWNIVYNEVINNTRLYKVMIRDINWKVIENGDKVN